MTDRPLPDLDLEDVLYLNMALSLGVPVYYDCVFGVSRYSILFQPMEAIRHVRGQMDYAQNQILVSVINYGCCYVFDIIDGGYLHPSYVQEKLNGITEYDAECLTHLLNAIRTAPQP